MNNETISRQNRVLSPIILAVTLIVIVLIMRPFYISFIEQSAVLAQ